MKLALLSTLILTWTGPAAAWVPQPFLTSSPSRQTCIIGAHQTPFRQDDPEKKKMLFPWESREFDSPPDSAQILQKPVPSLETPEGETSTSPELMAAGAVAAGIIVVAGIKYATNMDFSPDDLLVIFQNVVHNPSGALDQVVQMVESMGPLGAVYFGLAYTIAEVLCIPAIPLTASSGFLFGPVEGTAIVLLSASIAATISFVIGRTLLRDYVESVLDEYPKFAKIDKAIGKEGFKLMLLLRLSPIFPFALSNYLYGASSINFSSFFWGTLLGFAPGTVAYVYTGYVGKALTDGGDSAYPWFVYAGGLTVLAGFLKVLADSATRVFDELEEEGV